MSDLDRARAAEVGLTRLASFGAIAWRVFLFMLIGPLVSTLVWPTWQVGGEEMRGVFVLTLLLGYGFMWPITGTAALTFAFSLQSAFSLLGRIRRLALRKAASGALAGAFGGAIAVTATFVYFRLQPNPPAESSIFSGTPSSIAALVWLFVLPGAICGALVALVSISAQRAPD